MHSSFAFKFNLRYYTKADMQTHKSAVSCLTVMGRGLHSSTFRLNLSAFYGIGGAPRRGV